MTFVAAINIITILIIRIVDIIVTIVAAIIVITTLIIRIIGIIVTFVSAIIILINRGKILQAMYNGDECSVGKATVVAKEEGCKVFFFSKISYFLVGLVLGYFF